MARHGRGQPDAEATLFLPDVLSPEGELRQFVNVFVGSRNVRSLEGLATPLAEGDVIM